MAVYDPPKNLLTIFNNFEYEPSAEGLTPAAADLRYLKLSGGIETGVVLFQSGLTSAGTITTNDLDTGLLSDLTIGGTNSNNVVLSRTGKSTNILGTANVTTMLKCNAIDSLSSGILYIGSSGIATAIQIGRIGLTTNILGTAVNAISANLSALSVTSSTYDSSGASPLTIAGSNASSLTLSRSGIATSILGSSTAIETLLTSPSIRCPLIDTATSVPLVIGGTNASSIAIGKAGITTNIGGSVGINTLDVNSTVGTVLNIGITQATNISIGSGTAPTVFLNSGTLQCSGRVLCTRVESLSGTSLNLGTVSSTSIAIGNSGICSINTASTNISNLVNCPAYDTAAAVAMTIGATNASSVTIGKAASSNLIMATTPYIISTANTSPRIGISRWIMTTQIATRTTTQPMTTNGYGNVAFTAADPFNSFSVGTTLRYKFSGFIQSMSGASTMALQLTHAGGTQNFFSITFAGASNQAIYGEVYFTLSAIGTAVNPWIGGYYVYTDGSTLRNVPIQIGSWTTPLNTTVSNSMAVDCVVSGTTTQFVINTFTVEQLR